MRVERECLAISTIISTSFLPVGVSPCDIPAPGMACRLLSHLKLTPGSVDQQPCTKTTDTDASRDSRKGCWGLITSFHGFEGNTQSLTGMRVTWGLSLPRTPPPTLPFVMRWVAAKKVEMLHRSPTELVTIGTRPRNGHCR